MKIEYYNLYTHFVFTTFHREPVIIEKYRERIEKYITGVVRNYGCRLYAIYLNPEHLHFLVSRSPDMSEEFLADIVAKSSSEFINGNKMVKGFFRWQLSCSVFSVSKGNVDRVCKYILNQPEHHKTTTFKEEYDKFIKYYEKTLKRIR